ARVRLMRVRNCGKLVRYATARKAWHRAIRTQYQTTSPLGYAHTSTIPGRFNPGSIARPGFPVLYFGDDPQSCLFEVHALLGSPLPGLGFVPNPASYLNWVVIDVVVTLQAIVDLTRPRQ